MPHSALSRARARPSIRTLRAAWALSRMTSPSIPVRTSRSSVLVHVVPDLASSRWLPPSRGSPFHSLSFAKTSAGGKSLICRR